MKNMKQQFLVIIAALCCFAAGISAQQSTHRQIVVTGVVTDENQEPLIGANVSVKDVVIRAVESDNDISGV